ncbi:MAG: hypothetical protein A2W28_13010 [Gammaproteobacteria bacterium RBG_16_51_14]|nr:MAG: hypothetical protein A2W28_13010 [Gammaproteobacteria bacterium RBG_16_51_14]
MARPKDTEDFKKVIDWWIRKDILIALYSIGLLGAVLFDATASALWKMLGAEIDWFPVTKVVLGFTKKIDEKITDFLVELQQDSE